MELFNRIKKLFGANSKNENDDPEQVLHLYIEGAEERLREFKVMMTQLESKLLGNNEQINTIQFQIDNFRKVAEDAIIENNIEKSRGFLNKAIEMNEQLEEIRRNSVKQEEILISQRALYNAQKAKLELAKERRDSIIFRGKSAIVQRDLINSLNQNRNQQAMDNLQEKILHTEAEVELSRSLDDEIAELVRKMR